MGYYGELDGQVMEQNILLIIDPQMDFCDPYRGTLYVDGAVQDMFRLSDFIEHNKALFDHIIVSLDSHSLYQPFHPDFWVAGDSPAAKRNGLFYNVGENPQPFIDISLDDMEDDIWVPVHRSNFNRMVSMFKQLKEHGQVLTIWPVHCILGTPGHAVHPRLMEAINVHSRYWRNSCDMVIKGQSPNAEHYGVFYPEATFADDSFTSVNIALLDRLYKASRIYVAGEAKSHCVLTTLKQMIQCGVSARKIYVLTDCMSSVPDVPLPDGSVIEFDKITEKEFDGFKEKGIKFMPSTSAWIEVK